MNRHIEVVKYLIDHGANVNKQARNGRTPLHWSAMKGHVDILEYLLDHRADVSIKDDEGCTALALARLNNKTACVQVLEIKLKFAGEPWPLKELSRQVIRQSMVRTYIKGYTIKYMGIDVNNLNKLGLSKSLVNYLQYR
eukprot:TRINITY_DN4901_c1_g2_i2.p1 TRINITY_DN4901_c1_g2~~TRINITY_DN4901_c1_g2_i2.p1  ORF type:complete len:139 (+),score=13.47 TRINITY_DN4901_c1_g2_i2:245-661(+)